MVVVDTFSKGDLAQNASGYGSLLSVFAVVVMGDK